MENLIKIKHKFPTTLEFRNLMKFRITDILVVSSDYDYYIFEEDGRLYDLLRSEYNELNLSHAPEFTHISSGKKALEILKKKNRFDLIIVTLHISDMEAIDFARRVRLIKARIPVVLLGYDSKEFYELYKNFEINIFDKVFIWQGDFRIIIGIIKFLEDKFNLHNDTSEIGVQSIILIEDNVKFYSSYLPLIYTELLKQSRYLAMDVINLSQKFLRMRARPKILLCTNYEEAEVYFNTYHEFILGVISDVDFKRKGIQDPKAGLEFCKFVKKHYEDIPVLLQSKNIENKKDAYTVGASFLLKESPTLLNDLRNFMTNYFSFGDFIFRNKKHQEVDRAKNLDEFEEKLSVLNEESLIYHAERNHFSNWLKARTEFALAEKLRPKKISDFDSITELRETILETIKDYRRKRYQRLITDFNRKYFAKYHNISRIGGGSLGGKARGLGFINNLILNTGLDLKYPDVKIFVPSSVILATEVFDEFIAENNLLEFGLDCNSDAELIKVFASAEYFPQTALHPLMEYIEEVNSPLAVRSSSLLEDSQGSPFAGIYDSYMIPNSHKDKNIRHKQLIETVKMVFASIFKQRAKSYIEITDYRIEEEKMAVIIQEMVGIRNGNRFYPDISGVAKSYNFYPAKPIKADDGIANIALGQGKTITDGGTGVHFCPKYPTHLMKFATIEDQIKFSQREFYYLDLKDEFEFTQESDFLLEKGDLSLAEKDKRIYITCSTYSHQNYTIYDGVSRSGLRLFTLAPLLKYKLFPLAEILCDILELGKKGMGTPIEIEFAANLSNGKNEFGLLQMRPLVVNFESEELNISGYKKEELLIYSENVLGNGVVDNIYDIVYVDINLFNRSESVKVAEEIAKLNGILNNEKRPYLLIGIGRWGTLDPWLGIPVHWEQISGAKAIVECSFKDFDVEPSQGSHFFQNITSFKIGYFSVLNNTSSFIDWNWLRNENCSCKFKYSKHIRLKNPLLVKINGRKNKGIILKPNSL